MVKQKILNGNILVGMGDKMLPPEILEELRDKLALEEWRNKVQEANEKEFNEEEEDEYGN